MGANSKIEWTDHTYNPWRGCAKVSPGCAHCYAEALDNFRDGGGHWGKGKPRIRASEATRKEPLKWNKFGIGQTERARVFSLSRGDWLDDEVPIEWLADLLRMIHETPELDWLLLTKRPENWRARAVAACENAWTRSCDANTQTEREALKSVCRFLEKWVDGEPPGNVWIGTSVENQEEADTRIPELVKIPAKVRFLSVEPMLGAVDLNQWLYEPCVNARDGLPMDQETGQRECCRKCDFTGISNDPDDKVHWVICGGESGPGKRPMDLAWARALRDQCAAAQVPFFMKQVDKVQAIPADLMIREFPNFSGVSLGQVKETV